LYISHKLDEIQALCDTATVLRAGRVAGTAIPRQESARSLAELMIGKELPVCRLTPRVAGEKRLVLQNLSLATSDPFGTRLQDINLDVCSGEIVGIAGISGNGQQELLKALSGEIRLAQRAAVQIESVPAAQLAPDQRRAAGLCFVPEERLGRGAVPELSLAENALLTAYIPANLPSSGSGMLRRGLIQNKVMAAFARQIISAFQVKCSDENAVAASLSGGNLQKFIVGRETMLKPRVMIVAQPTWGVDVGAAILIRQALIDLRDAGVAVLVISEELDELFMMCDRIAVLSAGKLSRAVPLAQTSINQIGVWMSGDFTGEVEHGQI